MEQKPSRDTWASLLLPLGLILGLILLLSLNVGPAREESTLSGPLEQWLKLLVGYLAAAAEFAAALVIGLAVLRAVGV